MHAELANGIRIEYEVSGNPSSPAVLLIMGRGSQLTAWDPDLCNALVEKGFYVIRYDNRDVGLSTWLDDLEWNKDQGPPYTIADMALDASQLLDALDIPSAHVVGLSMGGLIAQAFAINFPRRVRTLVSIMSSTGNRSVGRAKPGALAALKDLAPTTRDAFVEQTVKMWRIIGSPGFAFDEPMVRTRAAAAFDRAFHPQGSSRHWAAVVAQPDRTEDLRLLNVPTLVIHGEVDPLVDVSGGRATAEAIPGAELRVFPGMGHNLPPQLFGEIVDDLVTLFAKG